MTNLTISGTGIALLKKFEGFRSKPYLDSAGVWTIGFGTTFINGMPVTKNTPAVTQDQATQYLLSDVKKFQDTINKSVKVPLNQNQFDALVCFVYNVGAGAFLGSTLLKVLNLKHYQEVPAQMLRWNKADGKVLPGLTARRQAEGDLFAA